MLRNIMIGFTSIAMATVLIFGTASVASAAVDIWGGEGCEGAKTDLCEKKKSGKGNVASFVGPIVQILLYISTIVSAIVIIVSGIKYATSAGDSGKVTSSKNALTYAVVGLVVSILALVVIQFVYGGLT